MSPRVYVTLCDGCLQSPGENNCFTAVYIIRGTPSRVFVITRSGLDEPLKPIAGVLSGFVNRWRSVWFRQSLAFCLVSSIANKRTAAVTNYCCNPIHTGVIFTCCGHPPSLPPPAGQVPCYFRSAVFVDDNNCCKVTLINRP